MAQPSFCLPSLSLCVSLILLLNSLVALEKNNQLLEFDQPREAYVRAVLDGMLWLEDQQKDTNAVLSQQHNQEHSDGEPEAHSLSVMREAVTAMFLRCEDRSRTGLCNRVLKTFPPMFSIPGISLSVSFSHSSATQMSEKESLCQMRERYERLLKEAKDELDELRQQVDESQRQLRLTQK